MARAVNVLLNLSAYESTWRRVGAVNSSVPAALVKGISKVLAAGGQTESFTGALSLVFWFTQDA
eukprot:3645068-Pyramimonas_sp.AAC.1